MVRNLLGYSLLLFATILFGQRSIRAGLEFNHTRVVEHTFMDEDSYENQAVFFANGELVTSNPTCTCETTGDNKVTLKLTNWWKATSLPYSREIGATGITDPEVLIEIENFLVKKAVVFGTEESVSLNINHINTRLSTFNFDQLNGIQASIKVELPFNRDIHFRVVCAKQPLVTSN